MIVCIRNVGVQREKGVSDFLYVVFKQVRGGIARVLQRLLTSLLDEYLRVVGYVRIWLVDRLTAHCSPEYQG